MNAREIALGITGVLPGWLSSFVLALIFLSVWVAPDWFGWDGMGGLRALVFIEAVSVYALLLIFGDAAGRLAWVPAIPLAVLLGFWVAHLFDTWLGIVLGAHLIIRTAGVWIDLSRARAATYELLLSLGFMLIAWFAVGLVWMPPLGWSATAVPAELWWDVVNWAGGTTQVPHALPAWGLLYFTLLSISDALHVAEGLDKLSQVDRTQLERD